MRSPTAATIRHEPPALANAFLALAEADAPHASARRRARHAALALLASLAIALALPLLWAAVAADPVPERAAATMPHKVALEADEDEPAGGL